jgi:predicted unusual protein kinase regulating ubiquinone biosynthesis (AarF/ABC1/UbiB family)
MCLFGAMLAGHARISVPAPVDELSTRRLLTMTWLDGAPFREAATLPQARRNQIAHALFDAWWRPLYRYAVVHGDAHLGNYTLRPDDGINLLDFGCARILPPRVTQALVGLYRAMRANDDGLAAKAYGDWGFAQVTPDLVGKMNVWSRLVFAPVLDDRVRTIGGDHALANGVEQIWSLKRRLREGSPMRPPREFVFVARAIVGIGAALVHLRAELNWHRLFEELIADFDVEAVARRQKAAIDAAGLA